MENIIHADIFFFITALAVIAITVIVVIIGIKVAAILENIHEITTRAKNDYDHISDGAKKIVKDIKDDGVVATAIKLVHKTRKSRKKIIN